MLSAQTVYSINRYQVLVGSILRLQGGQLLSISRERVTKIVLENLNKLKGNDTYRRINVTADYTIPKRKLVKEMKEQTKLKNSLAPDNSDNV